MEAAPADAARDINLTGLSMGQLRTANNRRNRAIRQAVAPARAATVGMMTGEDAVTAKTAETSAKAAS